MSPGYRSAHPGYTCYGLGVSYTKTSQEVTSIKERVQDIELHRSGAMPPR